MLSLNLWLIVKKDNIQIVTKTSEINTDVNVTIVDAKIISITPEKSFKSASHTLNSYI